MKFRIFGIQRSGTNYLEQMINEHTPWEATPGNPDSGFWKHSAFPELKYLAKEDVHLIISKNPFKWLESLHRYNGDLSKRSGVYHQNLFNNEAVVDSSQHVIFDSRNHATAMEGAINLYNTFYANWLRFIADEKRRHLYFLRYEDLLRNQTSFISKLLKRFNRHSVPSSLPPQKQIFTVQNVNQSSDFSQQRLKDYLDDQRFKILDESMLKRSMNLFNSDLIHNKMGYRIPNV